jgi:hypothetical protein
MESADAGDDPMTELTEATSLPQLPAHLTFTPEFRLLAACSWIAPPLLEQLQRERIAELCNQPVDWNELLSLVDYHGVQALVYESLNKYATTIVSNEVLHKLKARKIRIIARSLQQTAELVNLIELFGSQDIDLIPLKGVTLSIQLYGDPCTRSSSDIDILIKPENLDRVFGLLEKEGFQSGLHGTVLSAKQLNYIRNNLYHMEYSHAGKGLTLEVHWNLGSLWLPAHVNNVWNALTHMTWMGTRITNLDDDTLLLFLCDHGSRHRFCSLKWLSDVARILSSERPQGWSELFRLADSLDLKHTLTHTALMVRWVYGIELDNVFRELIGKDAYAVMMSRKILELLIENSAAKPPLGKRLGGMILAWQVLRLRPRVPIIKTLKLSLIAAIDFHDFPLPDCLFWLYYPLRPLSWLWRYFQHK